MQPPAAAARLAVRVVPGARRSSFAGRHGDGWRVRVTAPPEDGRANAAVVELIASALGVERRRVTIVRGHTARDKVIEIDGLAADEAAERLMKAEAGR
jgi:uncharacterized protein (TIGR00251 family)